MLRNPVGDSFPRMHSKANSGKSRTDTAADSPISTLGAHLLLEDIFEEILRMRAQRKLQILSDFTREYKNSCQNKLERNATSLAHEGRGCKGRDLKRRMRKGKKDTRKKSIRKGKRRDS